MSRGGLTALFAFMFASSLHAQEASTGTVRLYALTEIGTPIDRVNVRIEGVGQVRTIEVRGPTTVDLPYGVYTFACLHKTLATQFKVVRVEKRTPIDVIFGLPVANPGQVTGEGDFSPFEVSGRITPAPKALFGRVKVVGIFTEDSGDSKIDDQGRFRILLRDEGVYRLFVLYGKNIVYEHTLDLTFATPRQVNLDLRIDLILLPAK